MANDTTFLVDGFNLYHSLRTEARSGNLTRWLDLRALCSSYLYLIGGGATLKDIHYFTAIAHHRDLKNPGTVQRHQDYIAALESTGITPQIGSFKRKGMRCPHCAQQFERHEEKETDVAIATKLLELILTGGCDHVVIVSGDTDLIPAIRTARRLQPGKQVCIAFPHRRYNAAFVPVADRCFKIKAAQYSKFQLADPVTLADGRQIAKPAGW